MPKRMPITPMPHGIDSGTAKLLRTIRSRRLLDVHDYLNSTALPLSPLTALCAGDISAMAASPGLMPPAAHLPGGSKQQCRASVMT
jgi:hypothetical protein